MNVPAWVRASGRPPRRSSTVSASVVDARIRKDAKEWDSLTWYTASIAVIVLHRTMIAWAMRDWRKP